MALLINQAAPAGTDSPTLGDDQIRAFKLAIQDIFNIPDNTTITQAVMDVDASGLAQVIFYDAAALPASGEVGRNGSTLYYRITDARTATTTRALGITADTTGAPAASIGVGMLFQAESADESPADFGALDFVASDIGADTEDTYASLLLRVAGATLDEKYRFVSTAGSGFTAIFTHAATADRTYTLPDETGTLLVSLAKNTIRKDTTNFTTSSATFVDVTDLTLTITTGARRVLLLYSGSWYNSGANSNYVTFDIDGTDAGVTNQGLQYSRFPTGGATDVSPVSIMYVTDALTAGSHTFKVNVATSGGTLTVDVGTVFSVFSAIELA